MLFLFLLHHADDTRHLPIIQPDQNHRFLLGMGSSSIKWTQNSNIPGPYNWCVETDKMVMRFLWICICIYMCICMCTCVCICICTFILQFQNVTHFKFQLKHHNFHVIRWQSLNKQHNLKHGKQLSVLYSQYYVASFFMIHSKMCCTSHCWQDILNKEIWQGLLGKHTVSAR